MREIRLSAIVIVSVLAALLANGARYSISPFHGFAWLINIIASLVIGVWTIVKDSRDYQLNKTWKMFLPSILCCIGLLAVVGISRNVDKTFEKPTLLNAFYDGSYNGRGIDFKADGTYIMDDMAIGFVDYAYGTYSLDSNRIILDPPTEGSKHNIHYMVIVEPKNGDDLYLLETDSIGKSTAPNVKYRVRVDNRRR